MWWHTVTHGRGEVKWKLANGVGSQYSSHYLVTWCIQHYYRWCAPRLPVVDWTDAPADLNGLVRFAKRRNLVSGLCHHILTGLYTNVIPEKWLRDATSKPRRETAVSKREGVTLFVGNCSILNIKIKKKTPAGHMERVEGGGVTCKH